MTYDTFYYNGEADMLEIRLNILGDVVDEFRIIEAISNFGGLPKPIYFNIEDTRWSKWKDKIKHYVNKDEYTHEELVQAYSSPLTEGVPRWIHEFLQKEHVSKVLSDLNDEDLCFVGDVDEIWDPQLKVAEGVLNIKLRVYAYYLNLRSDEQFWGTYVSKHKNLKGKVFNSFRKNKFENDAPYEGWHFTNQGGLEVLKKKITDQYNPDVFGDDTMNNLETRFGLIDYIGRRFNFTLDESEWPQYLKDNKDKFIHLCKPVNEVQ